MSIRVASPVPWNEADHRERETSDHGEREASVHEFPAPKTRRCIIRRDDAGGIRVHPFLNNLRVNTIDE